MTRVSLSGVLYAFILALLTTTTNAATIDFGIEAPTFGTIKFAGGAAPLVGAGIEVDSIVGLDTPNNSDTPISCDGCILSFQTGAHTGGWNFGAGGSITIIGGAGAAGIGGGETLLSGTFVSATTFDVGGSFFSFKIVGASFTDTKHEDLLDYFGMPAGDYLGGLNISFSTFGKPAVGSPFAQFALFSGDIVNTPSAIPVPASVMLFGSGLLGLVGIARRRKAKA